MKISELLEDFLKYKLIDQDKSPKTIKLYRYRLKYFIRIVGDIEVGDITLDHITQIKYEMKKKNASSSYVTNMVFVFRSFLRYCIDRKKMNIIDPSTIKSMIIRDKNIIYYNNEEVKLLMDCIDINDIYGLRLRALCEVLLGTGVRIDEALQLDRDNIKSEIVKIKKDGVILEKKVFYAYVVGKGNKTRKVFFSDRSIYWVNRYLARREDNYQALFTTHRFSNRRLRYHSCKKLFDDLKINSGIDKPVHPHIFRHTFCSNLAKNGAELAYVQKMAGHSTINITIRFYANIDDRDIVDTRMRCLNYDN